VSYAPTARGARGKGPRTKKAKRRAIERRERQAEQEGRKE